MKKIISLLLAALMAVSTISVINVPTLAATVSESEQMVLMGNEDSGTCGENLTWTFNSSTGELKISGNGAMYDYGNGTMSPWSSYMSNIKTVTIASGVTTIGSMAFWYCSNIENITIPNTVTSIGNDAFDHCSSLTSIQIPGSVKSIGNYAFYACRNLKSVDLGYGVESIGEVAFENCMNLELVNMPASVTVIKEDAFYGCSSQFKIVYAGSQENWDKIENPSKYEAECGFTDIADCSAGVQKWINWASENEIVKGFSDGTFRPYEYCTRQQMVIMLWRLAGKPEPESLDSALKFTDTQDLSAGSKKAIAWAVENGITSGYKDGTFKPTDNVTRQQTVIMMWRLAGKPEPTATSANLTDINDLSDGAKKAIYWAAEMGITKGSKQDDGTYKFNPNDPCQRQHIATFVGRYANLEK